MDTSSVRAANRWDDGRVRSRKRPSREADTTIHELRVWGAGGCRRPLRQGWISPQPMHWESATTGKEQYSDQVSPPRRVRLCRNEDTIASSGRLFLVDGGPIELFYLSCLAANSNISN
eukprot:scaffold1665_cov270-Alexandrium_tamarense.AAC.22